MEMLYVLLMFLGGLLFFAALVILVLGTMGGGGVETVIVPLVIGIIGIAILCGVGEMEKKYTVVTTEVVEATVIEHTVIEENDGTVTYALTTEKYVVAVTPQQYTQLRCGDVINIEVSKTKVFSEIRDVSLKIV